MYECMGDASIPEYEFVSLYPLNRLITISGSSRLQAWSRRRRKIHETMYKHSVRCDNDHMGKVNKGSSVHTISFTETLFSCLIHCQFRCSVLLSIQPTI